MKKTIIRGILSTSLVLSMAVSAQACTICDENGVLYGENEDYYAVLQNVNSGFNRYEEKSSVFCATLSSANGSDTVLQEDIQESFQEFMANRDISHKIATLSTAKVLVNSNQVSLKPYIIEETPYFKLTDIAVALNGSGKQFQVSWNSEENAIELTTGLPQENLEIQAQGEISTAIPFTSPIYRNNNQQNLMVYLIDDASYIQLDSLAETLELTTHWDLETNTIRITS